MNDLTPIINISFDRVNGLLSYDDFKSQYYDLQEKLQANSFEEKNQMLIDVLEITEHFK